MVNCSLLTRSLKESVCNLLKWLISGAHKKWWCFSYLSFDRSSEFVVSVRICHVISEIVQVVFTFG